jgi:Family of unknown function (DUF6535)
VFYLANIYQLLADPNISRASILATQVQPPDFSPPTSAVLVNSLWFLSLVISLTSALLATMLQQWARRYLKITQPSRSMPHKRASIRAFFVHGVEKFHLPWSVETLPALLHLSLFLFFTGLAIYLFNINHTVFSAVVWWVVLAGGVYGCITFMPIFWHDSPYYSPLSSSAWLFFNFTYSTIRRILFFLRSRRWPQLEGYLGLSKTVQESGSKLSAEINEHILTWTIHTLEEDKDLEQFFEAIPGFCSSQVVKARDLELDFTKFDKPLADTFYGFISRTLSSGLFLEEDKKRRVLICAKATDAAQLSQSTMDTLHGLFWNEVDLFRSVDGWQSLRSTIGFVPGLCSEGIISGVIASVSERDERWRALALDQLGVSKEIFRNYLENGDSVLLANLIHITRPLFQFYLNNIDFHPAIPTLLSLMSKFDIRNTLPGLQHDFCDLWNEITQEAQSRETIPYHFLMPIRHLYIPLHQGTDAAPTAFDASTDGTEGALYESSSYPLCNIPGHHSDSSTAHPQTTTSPPADPPVDVETSHTSFDLISQGPIDTALIISPTSNSESYPHIAPAVSISTPHPSFSLPSTSSNIPYPLPSMLATSIPLPPPLDITQQSHELVSDLVTAASRLQVSVDTPQSSDGTDRPA